MNTIAISDIIIKPRRQRREFDIDALCDLRDSVLTLGLLHAIVLENDGRTLVSGERRIRALKLAASQRDGYYYNGELIPVTHLPFVRLHDLSPTDVREAELDENIKRVNLSWQEQAAAIQELADLRAEQAGGTRPTITSIAAEVLGHEPNNWDKKVTGETLIVAKHLNDPDISSAPTQKEALKRLAKKARLEANRTLAEVLGTDARSTEHTLHNADLRQAMPKLPSDTFAVIVTDPPYGVGAHSFGSQATTEHTYNDSAEHANELFAVFAAESFRVAAPQAHLYCFCDIDQFTLWRNMLAHAGWEVWRRPLIWDKGNNGMLPQPEHGPRYTYETIIFANKGRRCVNHVAADVLHVLPATDKEHGAEKPVELYADLLSRSALPGDQVLDPFAGSGPIFPAATKLRLRATGIELDPASYAIAARRMEE